MYFLYVTLNNEFTRVTVVNNSSYDAMKNEFSIISNSVKNLSNNY